MAKGWLDVEGMRAPEPAEARGMQAPGPSGFADALAAASASRRAALWLALGGCLAIVALTLGLFVASMPARYAALAHPDAAVRAQLASYGVSIGFYSGYLIGLQVFVTVCFVAVGVAVAALTRAAPRALFVAVTLITFGAALPGTTYAVIIDRPISDVSYSLLQGLGWFFLLLFAYLFPNGRFTPPWTRFLLPVWAAWVGVFFVGAPAAFGSHPALVGLTFLIWVAWFVTGAYAQYHRYLYASGIAERYQTKWVALGFFLAIMGALVAVLPHIGALTFRRPELVDARYQLIATAVISLCGLLIPVTIGAAILRRRLFDIDVIVNRVLVYGALSATLGGIYSLCVIALVGVGAAVTGRFSPSATNQPLTFTVATMVVAALARPLRRRVQSDINRRFYQRRYNLQRILETFGAELQHETELEQLCDHLLQTVNGTVQPAHISLWLAPVDDGKTARSRAHLDLLREQIRQNTPV